MPGDKVDSLPPRQEPARRVERYSMARRVGRLLLHSREASIAIAAIVLIVYFWSTAPAFLSTSNIANLAEYAATTAIIAAGEVLVIICAEVDLSAGMVYALAPFVMYFAHQAGLPFLPAILLALIAAAFVGLINGVITVVLRIPSFITTLGTLFVINGFTLTISNGYPVQPKGTPLITDLPNFLGDWHHACLSVCAGQDALGAAHDRHRRQSARCCGGGHQDRADQNRKFHNL
jgi:simple sugar transport system permease protein